MEQTNNNIAKLPFFETIKRSFLYVFYNHEIYTKLLSLGGIVLIYEMFTDFPLLASFREVDYGNSWTQTVSSLLLLLVSVAIVVGYCRSVILKNQPLDIFNRQFLRQSVFYILFSLIFSLFVMISFFIIVFSYGIITSMLGIALPQSILPFFILVLLFALLIPLSGLFLVFPAIAVNDSDLGIKKYRNAMKLAKGNLNAIFWGQIVMMIPGFLVMYVLMITYNYIASDSYIVNLIFAGLVLALSFLDSCFKASFYSHIYQFFVYYRDKK